MLLFILFQVLNAESRLRSTRNGLDHDDDYGSLSHGGGGMEGLNCFTCEDCNGKFSTRDTYAMHMLVRAKNDTCVPVSFHDRYENQKYTVACKVK